MLVIHGVWAYGAAQVWAEDRADGGPDGVAEPDGAVPTEPRPGQALRGPRSPQPRSQPPSPRPPRSSSPRPRPQRPRAQPRSPQPHPFAAAPGALAYAAAGLGPVCGELARNAPDDQLVLHLPSTADGPLASPELAGAPAGRAAGPARAVLAAWRVPTLIFAPGPALDLLTALGEPGGPAEMAARAVPGGSVHYLAALARLAVDLAARGRVLPALASDELAGPAARWRPVLSGADAQWARQLAAAMPPVCRAVTAEGRPAAVVFTEALECLTDAAVRGSLGADPGFSVVPPRRGRRPARVPLAERWAAALTGADAQLTDEHAEDPGDVTAARELAAALDAWLVAAQVPPGPVRTCFRLIEPPEPGQPELVPDSGGAAGPAGAPDTSDADAASTMDEKGWTVEFALQSTDDPSLLLPAADVWSGAAVSGWAAAGIRHPEEDLLAGLGAACRLFPELDQALRRPAPAAVPLDTEGAFRFLKRSAPLLSGAGFGVLLPDWVRKSRLGLRLTTRARTTSGGGATAPAFGLNDLLDFRYDLAVGDDTLDPEELAELARLKVPLVRLRGQWVELDDRHLQAALKFLDRRRAGTMTAGDALLAGLRGPDEDLPVVGVDAPGWLGDLLSGQAERRLAPVATPASFRGELRPYQERGLAWLSFLSDLGLGGVLADSMGLGKTVQILALLSKRSEGTVPPTLLVCPMSVVGNWQREAARFTPRLNVHVHHGSDRLAGADLEAALSAADLVITTYGLVVRDREALSRIGWARVVCDEAQNIKNSATRQAQAVRALPARSRIALTGTPVENRLTDLWSIMEFTSPGLLGPAERFRVRYALPIERNGDEAATARLKRITGPFILRRLKTDKAIISDLPDKLEMKVWCNLTAEQASLYQATVVDMLARVEAAAEGIERRGLVLATMAKLKQACNHPAHLLADGSRLAGRSGKLARLEELCDEVIAAGDKALCFTQYAEFGRMLQPYLAARLGCPVLFLHGGTPKKQRDALVAQFQEDAEPAVFLLSLKAGGTGLNLTAASHVIHVDRWWNPAVEDQATDRAFRIGQRKDVQVRKFVCVGTLEERIDGMIEEKKALAERIVGTGEGWLTELSVAELRKMVELSPEAVAE
jgi:superfamily II DNA or RNA helicase